MAKKVKATKAKKIRSYKIQKLAGVPSLSIRGKFLAKLGVDIGSRWEMFEGTDPDTIILKKVPQAVSSYREAFAEFQKAKQTLMVCEDRAQYLATQITGGHAS